MRRIIGVLVVLAVVSGKTTLGQETECDCEATFIQMTEKLEANYIGLRHFQQRDKGPEYEQRKTKYAVKSGTVTGENCAEFLQEFLDYFQDGHLYVIERPKFEEAKMAAIEAKIEQERVDIVELREKLKVQKASNPDDEVLGEYKDGTSEFIIVKEGKVYNAYIVSSKNESVSPGEIKASFSPAVQGFRGTYYSYAHIPRFMKGGLYKDGTLLRVEGSIWIKTDSEKKRELSMVNFEGDTDWPTVQRLDDDNVLMSIPKFSVDYKVWQQVVKDNRETLMNARNLIIDIRGNRGGNAIYFSIFDLFSDQIRQASQGHVLASEDNKAYFSRYNGKIYKQVVKDIEQRMGQIVDGPKYADGNIKRHKKSKVQNVAILTDEACMSAAESFILHAKGASSLVRTFGSPTDGVIDYTSVNAILLDSGDQRIYFGYPTSTWHKQIPDDGYNKTGIIPDVPIDVKVWDKVAFIMEYYKKAK
ncbi:MAG: hypothetical protein HEP71_01815 [Roseivirga sp.]|nr:hypothetical protein [Roseivirga sp.]